MKRYFTLIELLVVIAIIAILASMLLPALTQARERGRATTCLNNQKQIIGAALFYASDNSGFMPMASGIYGNPSVWGSPRDPWISADFVHAYWVYTTSRYVGAQWTGNRNAPKIYFCPTEPNEIWRHSSHQSVDVSNYGYYQKLGAPTSWAITNIPRKLSRNRAPSKTGIIADLKAKSCDRVQMLGFWQDSDLIATDRGYAPRHNNGCNAGFADGHAARLGYHDPLVRDGEIFPLGWADKNRDIWR